MDSPKGETPQTERAYLYMTHIYIYTHIHLDRFRKSDNSKLQPHLLKSSNVHTNTFHASNQSILQYMSPQINL